MALTDWLWLVRLIIEILKLISQLPQEELTMIANLRSVISLDDSPGKPTPRRKPPNAT